MKSAPRLPACIWALVIVAAFALLLRFQHRRIERVEGLTALAGWSVAAPVVSADSPTGYAGGVRNLIVPERNPVAEEWIMQAQLAHEYGAKRLRRVEYDNAPLGRDTLAPSPWRLWLQAVAAGERMLTGHPVGLSVERAALYAGPVLQLLVLTLAVAFVAWRFGIFAAALLALAGALLFPWAGAFVAGVPDSPALTWSCALVMLLALAGGWREVRSARMGFFVGGLAGGVGLWSSVALQGPVLLGVVVGALFAAGLVRAPATLPLPWRAWGLGGAVASVAGYAWEFLPGQAGWQLEVNHPVYALAWLGGAELLARLTAWRRGEKPFTRPQDWLAVGLSVLAIAALPVALAYLEIQGVFTGNPLLARLTPLVDFSAANLRQWAGQAEAKMLFRATCVPALLLVPVIWSVCRRATPADVRVRLALLLGPAVVALGFACAQLQWWNGFDAVLLALLAVAAGALPGLAARVGGLAAVLLALGPGLTALVPPPRGPVEASLQPADVEAVIARDLAHWLAQRAGKPGTIVFAPPNLAAALSYHGGLRGLLGFPAGENQDGMAVAIRLASAATGDEALALIERREIAYVVVPTWDNSLAEFARLGSPKPEATFAAALGNWSLPFWLRPVPYSVPRIPGFEGQGVAVFEVVEEQEPTVALARVAEYFVETGRLEMAAGTRARLREYPRDLGVLIALARIEAALGNQADFDATLAGIITRAGTRAGSGLPWDRRISLAMVLARGNRFDLARPHVERCLAEADEARLRTLPTTSLFHLQMLGKHFGLKIADERLAALARELLPPGEMRERLGR